MNKLTFLEIPLFEGLDRVHKVALLQEFTQLSYRKGDLLFEEGEFGDSLYIIMQGQARIYLGSGAKETTLAILGEKEYFGEMALLTGDPRSASAMAETDLVVLKLIKESFDRILYEHNALAVQFAGILAKRLARVNRQASTDNKQDDKAPSASAKPEGTQTSAAAAYNEVKQSEQREEVYADAERLRSPLSRALGLAASLGSGLLLYYAMLAGGISNTICALAAIGLTGLALTALQAASLPIVAVLMAAAAISLPGVNFAAGMAPSLASTLITALALTLSAHAVYRTGVVQRLLLGICLRIQGKGVRAGWIIGVMSALSAVLLPSSKLRSDAFALLQLQSHPRRRSDALSIIFIQSSSLCWFALAIVPGAVGGLAQWLLAALPLAAVMLLYNIVLSLRQRDSELLVTDPSILEAQLLVIGRRSAKETAALIIMLGGSFAMGIAPWLGVSLVLVSLFMLLALTACGLLNKTTAGEVRYEPFVVFALLAAMAGMYEGAGLLQLTADWVTRQLHLSAAGSLLLLFAIVMLLKRYIPPMAAIFAGMVSIGAGAMEAGASPIQAAVVAVLASQLPVDRLFNKESWNQTLRHRMIPACLAVLLAIPVWQSKAVGADRPVASSVPAMSSDIGAVLEVPFAVALPRDTAVAASIQRGVELALKDIQLQRSTDSASSVILKPEYQGDGKAGPAERQTAPVIGIALSQPEASFSQALPTFLLDGTEVSGNRSVALGTAPEVYAKEVAELLHRQGYTKAVIYYEDSNPGKQFAAALEKAAEHKGSIIVDRMTRVPARSGLIAASSRWKLLGTEAVVVYDSSGEAASEIGAALEAAGAGYPMIAGPSTPETDSAASYKGEMYGFTDFDTTTNRAPAAAFIERYRNAYGAAPNRLSAAAYDAVRLIALTAQKAAAMEPEPILDALKELGSWDGAVRSYQFKGLNETEAGKQVYIVPLTPKTGRMEGAKQ
ncbi:cyclic nucleotide-binding domain-containing protein [Paenibacillus sp. H1-7]|uniref:cyclic nucleotide-binding domain-containing protein n=1 Tax=Paenibacillus sp. H1-7 TaxID=2282849 RepID=UPI001EF827E6|nr:cyclic nucleotide-binding domain-containing protein [Paenibacillus sp. H1-7]